MATLIKKLINSGRTVFSSAEVSILAKENDAKKLSKRIGHYLKTAELYSIRRGVYSLSKEYDPLELSSRLFTPCYLSMQTVLTQEGVIFQFYKQIFIISYVSREIKIDNNIFIFKKIKDNVLLNPKGIKMQNSYSIANKERAFLDMIYLYPGYYFDNLKQINWDECFDMVDLYQNKSMLSRLNQYYKENQVA